MASLGWVTPAAATEGVTPLFFPEKPGDLFLVASPAVSPLASSSQNLATLFFAHRCHYHYPLFITFTRVSPPSRVSPKPFLPVRPRFSTILFKFAHKKIFPSGVTTPLKCVTRGGPPPSPPSDATADNPCSTPSIYSYVPECRRTGRLRVGRFQLPCEECS